MVLFGAMSDNSHTLNGEGGGGEGVAAVDGKLLTSKPADVVDGWKRVAQINMKAIEQVCGCVFVDSFLATKANYCIARGCGWVIIG